MREKGNQERGQKRGKEEETMGWGKNKGCKRKQEEGILGQKEGDGNNGTEGTKG